jgi:hypothetical protein
LPPYKCGQLRKEIENVVFTQKKGYVTDPIRVPNGFIILKIEERFEKGQAPYEDVEEELTSRLTGPQMQPKLRTYLTRLRQDAFLQLREGYVDTGAAPGKDTSWQDVAQLKPETITKKWPRAGKSFSALSRTGRWTRRRDRHPSAGSTPSASGAEFRSSRHTNTRNGFCSGRRAAGRPRRQEVPRK